MSNSMNVTDYLKRTLSFAEMLEKKLEVNLKLLGKDYIEFINNNFKLLMDHKPVIKHAGNGGQASNTVGQWQIREAGVDADESENAGPFIYVKLSWRMFNASEERSSLRLFTTNYADFPNQSETVINTIEGKIAKLTQLCDVVYRNMSAVKKHVDYYESKKDISSEEIHFLNYCKCYLAVVKNTLPWVGNIGEVIDEVRDLMINGYKFITKY